MKKSFTQIKKNVRTFAVAIAGVFLMLLAFVGGSFLISRSRGVAKADNSTYWTDYAATSFAGGDGTINNPYQISNARELAYLAVLANSGGTSEYKSYELTKPIDLSGHKWVPIGSGTGKAFYGQLNCNNNPIVGMSIEGAYEYAGLFGLVDSLAVTNAVILNANINITSETGSAGILAGTINYGAGNLQVVDSQFTGEITSSTYPATIDGVGGVIGTIRSCYPAGSKFENVYLKASINVPNRPSYACTGQIAGSCEVSFPSSNIINVVTITTMSGKNWSATKNSYKGTFEGTSSSPWFYYATLNSGIPQIKSQYHIGNSFSYTGEQIVAQLKTKGFSSAADSALITVNKKYVVTSTYSTTNNSSRSGFTASAQTRTGFPKAVYGEKVTVVSSAITGYELDSWSITSGTELNSSEFTMGNSDCTLNVVFKPLTYTVTLNPNGGTVSPTTKTIAYDTVVSDFPIATKSNYTMNGYWTAETGGTKVVDENGNAIANVADYTDENGAWIRTTATTLYAQWKLNESYLLKAWQGKIAEGLNSTIANVNPKIKIIEFTSTQPTTGTAISVGGIDATSTTAHGGTNETCYDVTAYVTGDSTNGYGIKFYSPHTIYFPADSQFLFSNSTLANRLTGLKTIIFNNINTSKVTKMEWMFYSCSSLTTLNLSNFNTSNVTEMTSMFDSCSSLKNLDLSSFNTSKVTYMPGMFYNCKALTTLDLSNFDTSKVTTMASMFYNCSSLTNLDLSNFNTSNVTTMYSMFYNCKALTTLDVSNFNTSKVTTMYSMFENCKALTNLDVSSFNTSKVINMWCMFSYCSKLTTLDVSSFNTSNVTFMYRMFSGCSGLTALDLSNFNTSKVTNMAVMFGYCSKLITLDLSNFDMTKATDVASMLTDMSALRVLQTPKNVKVNLSLTKTMYDSNGTAYTTIAAGTAYSKELRIRYDVTLNANGGTCSISTTYVRYGKEYGEISSLPTASKSVTGYTVTFMGWYTSPSGGTQITNVSIHNSTSNITLYAQYNQTPNTYKVTFDKQGGTGGTTNIWYKYEQSTPYYYYTNQACTSGLADYKITVPTRNGYTFRGYFTSTGGTGPQYVDANGTCINNMYLTTGNKTLYAYWTANTYQVKYNANGGSGSMSNSIHTYDVAKDLRANEFTRNGYFFAGWATYSSGAVVYYNLASVKNLTSSNGGIVNLYAKWTANVVTFVMNGSQSNGDTTSFSGTIGSTTISGLTNPPNNGSTSKSYSAIPVGTYVDLNFTLHNTSWKSRNTIEVTVSGSCYVDKFEVTGTYNSKRNYYVESALRITGSSTTTMRIYIYGATSTITITLGSYYG